MSIEELRISDSSIGNPGIGAVAENLPGSGPKTYYLTTAIAYTNGYPHIGHAYEFLTSDVLARYHRVFGFDTFFLTGSDEHGQKVANSADKAGRSPREHCDLFVAAFKALNIRLAVSYSDYIRTTSEMHERTAQHLWKMCAANDDIYLDSYEGWYNEREEVFVTDAEAEAANFLDIGSGLPLKRVKEESYFFRMGKYASALIKYIEAHPDFIEPEHHRNSILGRLRREGLRDLSISRTSFTWGIPVPAGFDARHVMYVWFDALSNYLTGVHALAPFGCTAPSDSPVEGASPSKFTFFGPEGGSRYWPAARHIIGKDIVWFHCVIWPCILMSAGLPLPGGVFAHGFVNAADGRKMSKSYNNTVDPHEILDKYPLDSVRYYMSASTTYGMDCNFSESTLVSMHNSELADILGNLVHRAFTLCHKYCDGRVPDTLHDPAFALPFDLDQLRKEVFSEADSCAINIAVFKSMEAARATNRYLSEAEPWKMKGADEPRRAAIVRTTLEAIYAFSHLLAPVMPISTKEIFDRLGTSPIIVTNLRPDLYNLVPSTKVALGNILFQKIEIADDATVAAKSTTVTAATKKKESYAASESTVEDPNQSAVSKLDLRVGRIVKVWLHETADRLFCEEIDIGEASPRLVASGLRQHYSLADIQNRLVVVVCNLKETKIQGFLSSAMVLASKSVAAPGERVELLDPPTGATPGEKLYVPGHSAVNWLPWPANKIKKNKVWEEVVADLSTNEDRVACWKGLEFRTSVGEGKCTTKSLTMSPIG